MTEPATSDNAPPDDRYRIQIVDDDVDFADALCELLETRGYVVQTVNNFADAVAQLSDFRPDVALIDRMLGLADGTDLIALYRERRPNTLCIMVTAYAETDSAIQALRDGAYDYLRKPLNVDEVFAVLERGLDRLRLEREKKQAERALHHSEDQYRQLVELCPDAIFIHDGKRIVFANPPAATLFGATSTEEIVGRLVTDFVPISHRQLVEQRIEKILETGVAGGRHELKKNRLDGSEFEAEVQGTHIDFMGKPAVLVILRDITERKQAEIAIAKLNEQLELRVAERTRELSHEVTERRYIEAELRKSEERLRLIMDNVVDGIVTVDENGIIHSFNPAAERIFGCKQNEAIGERLQRFVAVPNGKDHQFTASVFLPSGETTKTGRQQEITGVRQDGTLFPAEIAVSELLIDGQKFFTGIIRDITQRKAYEDALLVAKDQAEAANKAKSDFLSSMSHELRTPMNAILGFGQLLEQDYADELTASQRDYIEKILGAGNHLLRLINEVLDLAKIEAGSFELEIEELNIADIVADCLGLMKPILKNNAITLDTADCDFTLFNVCADYTRLKQVLMNLLSNAAKYNKPGGSISLTTEMIGQDCVRISVADTGIGVPEDRKSSLFEPFNRADAETSSVEGTGIGLSITKKLVEMMDGSIGFESVMGEGSVFWINLPAAKQIAPAFERAAS